MNYIRTFLQTVRAAPSDEELGRRTAVYPIDPTRDPRRSSVVPAEESFPVIETSEKLVEFRLLVGITTHGSFKAPRGFGRNKRPVVTTSGRPAPNTGIYMIVVDKEIKCKKAYKRFSALINTCLGVQIIVAAALTALGAAKGNHSAVTVFGAINTVIAGFLTYLKGSGLPNRFKFSNTNGAKYEKVAIIRNMFEEVRADVEANQPDRFVSSGSMGRKPLTNAPGPPLAGRAGQPQRGDQKMQRMDSGLSDMFMQLKEKASGGEKELEAYGSAASSVAHNMGSNVANDIGRLKSTLQDKMAEIANLEKELLHHHRKAAERRDAEFEKMVSDRVDQIAEYERDMESSAKEAAATKEREMEIRATDAVVDSAGRIKATLEVNDPFPEDKRGI